MIDNIDSIPNSWSVVRVDQVGELLRGINYNKFESSSNQQEHYLPILRSNNIQETLIFDDLVYVDKKNFSGFHSLRKGDIIFAMSSGSKHLVGKTAKVTLDCNYGWGAFCSVLRPFEIVDKNFIANFFKAPAYKKLVSEISKGTNINNLKREHILDLIFPLPPLTEQHRIVAKIEEQFSELDKGIEALKTAQEQLKVYRQAVLKYAFEGKLTNPNVKDGELAEGWTKKTISDVVNKSTLKAYPDKNSELQFLGMDSIEPHSTKPHMFYKFSEMKSAGNLFTLNQVLYGRMRPYLNKVWVANCDGVASGEFIVMTCNETILPQYLLNILHHQDFVNFANRKTSGDRPRISFDEVSEFEFRKPPINEQGEILTEIESRLSICDKIEESILQGLQQAEALRQSILKKAFEGKLVPQDSNDEPASVLLERIKAERAASKPMKKTRKLKEKA